MEMASYLAGERWSDHPACSHKLLATLARDVNDHVSDDYRSRLVPLIPSVIGLTSDDPHVDAWIAREVALTAVSVAPERQRVVAVGLLRCERVLAALDGLPPDYVSPRVRRALDTVPTGRDWAREFSARAWGKPSNFGRHSAPVIVHSAVSGIAASYIPDPERVLVELLERTIRLAEEWMAHEPTDVAEDSWQAAAELTTRKRVWSRRHEAPLA
jgi:hypothetical protein